MARKKPKTSKSTELEPIPLSPKLAAIAATLPKNWHLVPVRIVKRSAKKK
jgi:hypothetical protein